jgi:hypothetical protein
MAGSSMGLRLLSLCNNGMGPGAAIALGKLLARNASLQRLVSNTACLNNLVHVFGSSDTGVPLCLVGPSTQ